jgi:hypothetical protein
MRPTTDSRLLSHGAEASLVAFEKIRSLSLLIDRSLKFALHLSQRFALIL